jgi:myosin heavy subunit
MIQDLPRNLIQNQIKSILSEQVWIEDRDKSVWRRYDVIKQDKGDLFVRDVLTAKETVINLAFTDVYPSHDFHLMGAHLLSDMTTMRYLNEPAIVFNLKERYLKKLPYTFMGAILITANPFEWFVEATQTADHFIGKPCDPSNPHPYAIAG